MNSASQDIKDMLVDESSLGLTFAGNLFVGKEPSTPDTTVTIFETPGLPPQLTLDAEEQYYYPSVQIRIRGRSYLDTYTLAKQIHDYLHGRAHETWNSTLYVLIQSLGEPALLDWDDNNRCRFIMNFNIQRR